MNLLADARLLDLLARLKLAATCPGCKKEIKTGDPVAVAPIAARRTFDPVTEMLLLHAACTGEKLDADAGPRLTPENVASWLGRPLNK